MIALLALACATAPGNPLSKVDVAVDRTPFEATVSDRIEAGDYVYLQMGDRWTVGFDHGAEIGDRATATPIGVAHDFESARTGRTFETLWFVASVRVVRTCRPVAS